MGILYWDEITHWNLLSNNPEFEYAGTNPCAEEPLPAGGSCLLGSLNLSEFVNNKQFDFDAFKNAVVVAVEALNEVLFEGLSLHPLQEQQDSVAEWRQIGLGIFGLADMLIKLEIQYDSNKALSICREIAFSMIDTAIATSANLTEKYGTYPKYNDRLMLGNPFLLANASKETYALVQKNGLCNSQLLTIAPTGTLSTMLGVSGGIEPIFANFYTRKTESLHGEDVYYKVYTPIVEQYMKANGLEHEDQLPNWFVTAGTLDPMYRVKMQGVWQSFIDASISSTVNLPNEATVEEIGNLYMAAWKHHLKGLTIFRDGCKRTGILTTGENNEDSSEADSDELKRGEIVACSDDLIGKKRKLMSGCGSLHVLAYFDRQGNMQEVYLAKGSTGGCNNFMVGLSRTISLLCRAGVSVQDIKDQLDSTGSCPSYAVRSATKHDTSRGSCCPMAVGNALVDMWKEVQEELNSTEKQVKSSETNIEKCQKNAEKSIEKCPVCGEELIHVGGCIQCTSCAWSKCD